jgi:hypothetical protein
MLSRPLFSDSEIRSVRMRLCPDTLWFYDMANYTLNYKLSRWRGINRQTTSRDIIQVLNQITCILYASINA